VSWHVEFRHDANAALGRVLDDAPQLILRVVVAVGSKLVQLRILPALNAESLVLAQVKVQDVSFTAAMASSCRLITSTGSAPDIDQQPPPAKPGPILISTAGR
jgi:hypothetical protein